MSILFRNFAFETKLNDNNGTSGRYSPNIFPCTSISEKEVVFGGSDKLRSTIHNALRVIDADLFVVLSGCTGEIIGDDIKEVSEEFEMKKKLSCGQRLQDSREITMSVMTGF